MNSILNVLKRKFAPVFCFIFFSGAFVFSESNFLFLSGDFIKQISQLAFAVGLLIFVSQIAALIFRKLKLPQNLGELIAGLIISPYLLGKIIFPGIDLKQLNLNFNMPMFNEMLFITILSSIIILFMLGLETDLTALSHFSLNGMAIGFTGAALSFTAGIFISRYFLGLAFLSEQNLFMGFITSASSIGIISNIFREKTKIPLKERMSLFSSIIMDNIISIFAFIVFISFFLAVNGSINSGLSTPQIAFNLLKNLFIWLLPVFMIIIVTIIFEKISDYFKIMEIAPMIAIGSIILIIGLFLKFGIFIIIVAYIAGLFISKTKYNFTIRDHLRPIYHLFAPIFYVFAGMLFNIKIFIDRPLFLIAGILIILAVIIIKFAGNMASASFMKFKFFQSLRISSGLMPRFEIVLIIGFIGFMMNMLTGEVYTLLLLFVIISSLLSIPLFSAMAKKETKEVKADKEEDKTGTFDIQYHFESPEINRMMTRRLIDNFKNQGFSVNLIGSDQKNYQIKKDELFFDMTSNDADIMIESSDDNMPFINTFIYDTLSELNKSLDKSIKNKDSSIEIKPNIADTQKNKIKIKDILFQENIIPDMSSKTKSEALLEILDLFYKNGYIKEKDEILSTLTDREKVMSTGMQQGIAIPHCKSKHIDKMIMAVGINRNGINFDSIDGKPSRIFVMLLAPEGTPGPHLNALMLISTVLINEEARNKLLTLDNAYDIWNFFRA